MTDRGRAHLLAGGSWALASVGVALGSSLVRTAVIVACLAPVDIGLMGIALLALGFMEAVASSGVDTALVAETKAVDRYIDSAFTIQLVRGVLVTALLWAAAPALATVFRDDAAVGVIRAVGVIAALRGLSNPAVALVVRKLDFRRLFWWSLPEVLSSLCVTVALALVRRDVWALVIGALAGQAIGALASYGLVPRIPHIAFRRDRILDLLRFGRFVSGSRALMYFSVNLDAAVVGAAMGTHVLGLYQFATRVAELPVVTFTRAVGQVALPALSSLQTDAAALRRTWRAMLGWVLGVHALAAVLILLFGHAAVDAVAGERWHAAVPLMQILAVAMLFRGVIVLTGQFLDAVGRPAWTLRLNAARLAAVVLLLPPLAAWAGPTGVALAVLLVSAGTALVAARLPARLIRAG